MEARHSGWVCQVQHRPIVPPGEHRFPIPNEVLGITPRDALIAVEISFRDTAGRTGVRGFDRHLDQTGVVPSTQGMTYAGFGHLELGARVGSADEVAEPDVDPDNSAPAD